MGLVGGAQKLRYPKKEADDAPCDEGPLNAFHKDVEQTDEKCGNEKR